MKKNLILIAMLGGLAFQEAKADCFDDSAVYHGVNPWILRAIAYQESRFNPATVHRNRNNSTDYGLMGMNSVHLTELSKYGVGSNDLMDACKAIYVAGWRLKAQINHHGNTCTAIGTYHSNTAQFRDAYIVAIRGILGKWGIPLNC